MLCKYSYMIKEKKWLFGEHRYYTYKYKEVGEYECDTADFEKLFNNYLKNEECAIVLRQEDGKVFIWQPPKKGFKREVGGWQLVNSNCPYTETYRWSKCLQKCSRPQKRLSEFISRGYEE